MRDRLTALVILGACVLGAPAAFAADRVVREVVVDPTRVAVRSENGLDVVDLEGGFHGLEPGAPDLPLISVRLLLPEGTRAAAIRVHPVETVTLPGLSKPVAVPERTSDGRTPSPAPAASEGVFPSDPVIHVRNGRMRGHSLAAVIVSPTRWLPETGELEVMTRFRLEALTEPAPVAPEDLVIRRESREGRRTFERALAATTGNQAVPSGEDRLRDAPSAVQQTFTPTFRPSVDGSPVEMVIITTGDQVAEYQRLADLKTKLGITTVVRSVQWILDNYPEGVDAQETIRNFIKDAVSLWGTAWILLGGDTDEVPVRYGYTKFRGGQTIPTDLYYTDLDGNWNGNGDARFGEGSTYSTPGDDVDLFPDVWVGRLPSNNVTEAQVMVDKTLLYTQNPPLGYQDHVLFLGEVLFPDDWEEGQSWIADGADYCEAIIDTLGPNHQPVRLYENYTVYPSAVPETKSTVIDSINAGFNLVHHIGHGFINTMSVGIGHQSLSNSDAEGFVNGDNLFLLYAMNCTSCAIDFNCIGERFLDNPSGGAVAVIGSTDLEDALVGIVLQYSFYHLLFREGIQEIGMDLALCKVPYVPASGEDGSNRWSQFAQICLGDPSLHFWTEVPGTLSVTHASTLELGVDVFQVDVSRDGSPVDSARVTLFKDNDAYSVGYTDALGQVLLPFSPDSTGTFSVGVFADNALPYLGTATVNVPNAPYLHVIAQTVVDDGTGSSEGNGDARIDAGETVQLIFTLRNSGCIAESGISAYLTAIHPDVMVLDQTSSFADISPDSTATASDPIVIYFSRNAPDLLEIPSTLTVTGTSGTYAEKVILYVHAPSLEYWKQDVRDTVGNGNGDGSISVDEDFAIVPHIRNIGYGDLRAAEVRLRTTDGAVTVTDSVSVLGDIASHTIGTNPSDGLAARLSDISVPHELEVVIVDAYGEVLSRFVDLSPPGQPINLFGVGASSSVALTWDPVPDPDLWGYVVYRAPTASGPFVRVNEWNTGRTSYYQDTGLPGLTRFHYRVAAVDSSGNEGSASLDITISTTLPLHPGWPIEVATSTPAGMTMANLDGVAGFEILGAGEAVYVVTPSGEDYYDGDVDARTLGPLFDSGGIRFWNTPAVGDVDSDGHSEVAVVGFEDGLVYLVDHLGQPLPGWPKNGNAQNLAFPNAVGSVCMADLDSDGDLEIMCTIGRAILAWHHDGTEVADGDADPMTDGVLAITSTPYSYGTPSAANIDSEPHLELIAPMRDGGVYVFDDDGTPFPGFPFMTGGDLTTSPAIGDIDLDGAVEIVFASSADSTLYAIRSDLTSALGFPKTVTLDKDWDSSPALGDISGDGYPDVAIGSSDGLVFAWSGADGTTLPGFPVSILDNLGVPVGIKSSPVLADVDNDGAVDLLIGDDQGKLHAFDSAGQVLPGFPIQTGNRIESAPMVWDADGDGLVEVLVQSKDQRMYCWDTPWAFDAANIPWPMFKGNPLNSGDLSDSGSGIQIGIRPPEPGRVLLQNFPNPFSRATSVRYQVPDDGGYKEVTLRVHDLSGRVVRTLVAGEQPPGLHEAFWNGRDDAGRRVASGIYPYRLRVGSVTQTRKMILLR